MAFADRLDKAIMEALTPGGALDAQSTVELSKQHQRVRIVERAADQAVHALEQIHRVLKAPDYKGDASFDALTQQIENLMVGLDKGGNMRRGMTSLLTMPPEIRT